MLTRSPGFGLTLVAESTTSMTHAAESSTYSMRQSTVTSTKTHDKETSGSRKRKKAAMEEDKEKGQSGSVVAQESQRVVPEDIGTQTASLLLEEIIKVSL